MIQWIAALVTLKQITLFTFGRAGSSLLHRLSIQLWRVGLLCRCGAPALTGTTSLVAEHGLSVGGLAGFGSCSSQALEHRLRSCGAGASLPRGMWDIPRSETASVSPSLVGGFSTTEPPARPLLLLFKVLVITVSSFMRTTVSLPNRSNREFI